MELQIIPFFLFLALLFFAEENSAVSDELALLDFKNHITNAEQSLLANNWTTNTSFCNWVGITCTPQTQTIISLNLSNMNLQGQISPSIFTIPSLRGLYLSNNSLSGPFLINGDDDGDGLVAIEAIDLSSNALTGQIPSSLCRFRELRSLFLSYNNLTGQIPRNIGCLSRLERLYMTENKISGTIPPSIGNISSLRFLGCVGNIIGGEIPHELGNLSNLRMLGFDYNRLTGEIPASILNLSSLVYIALTDNTLSGTLPAALGLRLPNLEGIYLADNLLRGEIPRAITNATKLKELELSYNMFVGSVPNDLGNLKELLFLNVAGNQLTNAPGNEQRLGFIDSLSECRMLQFLIAGNNPLQGMLPGSVRNLSSSIEMFNVENARIYGEIPVGIGNMSSMISLALNGNNLTGNIPSEIGYLEQLQRLYLSRNKLQGNIPIELCNLVNLGEVMLFENELSGSIPSCIGNLGRVQRLMLGYNRLSSNLPLGLWGIKDMLFLNVSNNLIEGGLPSEIGMMGNIEGIDLSSNRFSSVIPSTLGELQSLRHLSLSKNSFEGSIPTSFGNLISLEFLDLSSNNLSGTIPLSLEGLSHLGEVNMSFNRLEGQIPNGGVFSNSSPQSFTGNKGLCGMPSLEVPLCAKEKGPSSKKKHIVKIIIPVIVSVTFILVSILFSLLIMHRRKRVKREDDEVPDIVAHRTISYHEILKASDGFSEANLLGTGGSGSVYRGTLSDGEVVAIKVLNLENEEAEKRFDAECEVLKQIRHRNLVKVITTCSNDSLRAIVLPYMINGSLDNWLYNKQDYTVSLFQRVDIMIDVAMVIEYLHHGYEFPVVHCDLKPANVLLDADMVAHVSDFGISKILAQNKSSARTMTLGTIGYIAPEYGSEGTISTAGDVYSYGIMLMEAVTRRKPTDERFSDNMSMRQWVEAAYGNSLMEILDGNLFQEEDDELSSHCLISVIELALDCSKKAPEDRINMKDALIRLIKIKERFLQTKEN